MKHKIYKSQPFRLHTYKKVMSLHLDMIFPELGVKGCRDGITAFALTTEQKVKLEKLRAKYKVSKSAIIRILLDSIEV